MTTLKQRFEQNTKDIRLLSHLITLQKRGNIAKVVAGNECPRKALCMCELTAIQMYQGRGRQMIVPAGCNPFETKAAA